MSAIPTKNTVAAAVWPEGKLEVAGVEFRRGTAGRGRATTNVTERNTLISRTSASARNAASARRRRNARNATTTAAPITTGSVLIAAVATDVIAFQVPVRCRAR